MLASRWLKPMRDTIAWEPYRATATGTAFLRMQSLHPHLCPQQHPLECITDSTSLCRLGSRYAADCAEQQQR